MVKKSSEISKRAKRRIFIDSIGVLLIIISPFVFKLHQYLPSNPEATITFLGFVLDSNGFADLNTYAWFLLSKIVPFYLFIIWFFTCKHWWYHIILIPATMYAFQIFEVLYSDDNIVDTRNIIWLLPVCMVVIPLVYLIRIKLYDKHVHGIDLEAMEAEIKVLREKQGTDKKQLEPASTETPKEIGYKSLSEKINEKLSTDNIESHFRQFQNQLGDWLHFRF
jgi:hypothetical protein